MGNNSADINSNKEDGEKEEDSLKD